MLGSCHESVADRHPEKRVDVPEQGKRELKAFTGWRNGLPSILSLGTEHNAAQGKSTAEGTAFMCCGVHAGHTSIQKHELVIEFSWKESIMNLHAFVLSLLKPRAYICSSSVLRKARTLAITRPYRWQPIACNRAFIQAPLTLTTYQLLAGGATHNNHCLHPRHQPTLGYCSFGFLNGEERTALS